MISFIIVLLPGMAYTNELCDIHHTKDGYDTGGVIDLPDHDRSLTERQNCDWNLEAANFTNHILYVQISKFDFENTSGCKAYVTFDSKEKLCRQRKQCILFLRNHSKIEFDFVDDKLGFQKSQCKYLAVDRGDFSRIQIQTNEGNLSDFRFKLSYKYIELPQAAESDDRNSTEPERRQKIDNSCGTGLVATLVVVSVLLVFAVVVLCACAKINKLQSLKMQPRTRGSFYQTDSVDCEVDLPPVHSLQPERKPSRSALTRFSKLTRKGKGGNVNTNFIHFTLSRNESETPKRSKSLPDIKARLQVNPPDNSGGSGCSKEPNSCNS